MGASGKTNCEVSYLKKVLDGPVEIQVIDVREPGEWNTKHIPKTANIPLSKLDLRIDEINKEKPVYILCEEGFRAQKAMEKLSRAGFTNLIVVDGGIKAWQKSGYPVESGKRNVWPIDKQVRFAAGAISFTGVIFTVTMNPLFIVVPCFVSIGLMFSAVTGFCPMATFLCKMPWNK